MHFIDCFITSYADDGACQEGAWYEQALRNVDTTEALGKEDVYYESTGLFVARDEHIFVSMNGGDNGDLHGHNDSGSLIIYKNNKPLLIDPGVEAYTKKTFSPERYTIWTMQSAYHNVMNFGNDIQQAGRNYKTETVDFSLGKGVSFVELELAGCGFDTVEKIEIADEKLANEWNGCLYRTKLKVVDKVVTMEIKS